MLTNTAVVVTSRLLFAKGKVLEAYAYTHVLGSDLQMPWRRTKRASKQQPHTAWIKHIFFVKLQKVRSSFLPQRNLTPNHDAWQTTTPPIHHIVPQLVREEAT